MLLCIKGYRKIVLFFFLFVTNSAFASCTECKSIPILMYHHISDSVLVGETTVSPDSLKAQLDFLKDSGYRTITMSQLGEYLNGENKTYPKTIAITFDDGWKDQLRAAQLLKERNQTATFFILTSTFDDLRYFNKAEVNDLSKEFEIGTHTHTHFQKWEANLHALDTMTAVGEAVASKSIIESIIKKPVKTIAWPYGYFTEDTVRYIKSVGFTTMATLREWNGPDRRTDDDPSTSMDVRRLNIDGRCKLIDFISMVESQIQRTCL